MSSDAYDPPLTNWWERQRHARDILETHLRRRSRLSWLRWPRGWRCRDEACAKRWPCPAARWAREQLGAHVGRAIR